jgi:hypothetical protein
MLTPILDSFLSPTVAPRRSDQLTTEIREFLAQDGLVTGLLIRERAQGALATLDPRQVGQRFFLWEVFLHIFLYLHSYSIFKYDYTYNFLRKTLERINFYYNFYDP